MKTIPVSILVAGILTPSLCHAQKPGESKEHKFGHKSNMEAWAAADTDHDHFISKQEFDAIPRIQELPEEKRKKLFTRLDKEGDGKLSVSELSQFGKSHSDQGDKQPMKRLWDLDVDKSGGISLEEFKAGQFMSKLPPEKQEAVFRRLDTDGDGFITLKDRPEPPFKHPDGKKMGGGEGKGPNSEFEPLSPEQIVRKLDTNGDQLLSFEEFRLSNSMKNLNEDEQEKRFNRIDTNKDLKISIEELAAARRRPEPPAKAAQP